MPTQTRYIAFVSGVLGVLALAPAVLPAQAQITIFDEVAVHATLTGQGLSPAVATGAVGECTGRLVPATGSLDFTCSHNVAGGGDVLLTQGGAGNGGVQLANVGAGAVVGDEMTLTQAEVAALLTGQVFAVVTSSSHPGGEIAARLLPKTPIGQEVMRFPLRQDSLVHSGSSKVGSCLLRITADRSRVTVLCSHDVANPQQLRVIIDGGVVQTVTNVGNPFQAELTAIANTFSRFLDGHFGLVLTSAAFPEGELGMVLDRCIEGPNTLCLNADRFRVTMEFTRPGRQPRLAGAVQARSNDSGLFYFFEPANWESMVKVLNACSINGNFWVFLSANTNLAFEVTVYDTLTGRVRRFSNPQGTLAAPRADTTAFSCS